MERSNEETQRQSERTSKIPLEPPGHKKQTDSAASCDARCNQSGSREDTEGERLSASEVDEGKRGAEAVSDRNIIFVDLRMGRKGDESARE